MNQKALLTTNKRQLVSFAEVEDEDDSSDHESDDDSKLPKLLEIAPDPRNDCDIDSADTLQCFSHYSYRCTKRRMIVCDLQGVHNTSENVFQLTDPVIHWSSSKGRVNVCGRTDHGKKGIKEFFKTHKCSDLCRRLGLCK